MERLRKYTEVVRKIMQTLQERVPVNRPDLQRRLVISQDGNEFILVSLGYHKAAYQYNVVAHVEVRDDSVLIYEESVDPSVFERLVEAGVAEKDIVTLYATVQESLV